MSAHLIIENILLSEGRVEDFRKTYKGKIDYYACDALVDGDPSGNHKYLDWAARRMVESPGMEPEHLMHLLGLFHKNVRKTDIYTIKSVEELAEITGGSIKSSGKTALEKAMNVIYKDDEFTVYAPLTHEASCQIDGNNWCIGRGSESFWDNYYNEQGNAVVMVMRNGNPTNEEEEKNGIENTECAIVGESFNSAAVWDAQDNCMSNSEKSAYLATLPDEARDAIEYYMDRDDGDTRREEFTQKKSEEKFKDDGIRTICSNIADVLKERGVDADADEVGEAIVAQLPDGTTLEDFCWRIWDTTIMNHGFEEAGWIGHKWANLERLLSDAELDYEFELEALVQHLSRVDQVDDLIAQFTQHPANFTERDDVYNAVLRSMDFKRSGLTNRSQEFLRLGATERPAGARPRDNLVPRTIKDLIQMFRDADFGEIADEIEADRLRDSKGNVYESVSDVEDAAASYVEEGLGRHDWVNNWKAARDEAQVLEKWVSKWHPGVSAPDVRKTLDQWAVQGFEFR